MERVMGIEPTTSAWKAEVLPLNYTRIIYIQINIIHTITAYPARQIMERKTGFEPATPTLARWCSTTELLPQFQTRIITMVSHGGFEPPTL